MSRTPRTVRQRCHVDVWTSRAPTGEATPSPTARPTMAGGDMRSHAPRSALSASKTQRIRGSVRAAPRGRLQRVPRCAPAPRGARGRGRRPARPRDLARTRRRSRSPRAPSRGRAPSARGSARAVAVVTLLDEPAGAHLVDHATDGLLADAELTRKRGQRPVAVRAAPAVPDRTPSGCPRTRAPDAECREHVSPRSQAREGSPRRACGGSSCCPAPSQCRTR